MVIRTVMMTRTTGTTAMTARTTVRPLQLVVSVAVIAAALLAVGVFLFGWGRNVPASLVTIGGPFTLTTHAGEKLSDTDLKGTPFAVFFGFTHCPEVCPTTLWEMSESLTTLGDDADKLKVLFISVDPKRDTPESLALYLQSFDPRILGLTGSEEAIRAIGQQYRAYWQTVPLEGGDYTIDHTASVFLMDDAGKFIGTISYGETMEGRLEKLRRLISAEAA